MNNNEYNKMTRKFLMGEGFNPSPSSYIQSLKEIISSIRASSATDARRLEMANSHLREIKRHFRKLEERLSTLEEQIKVLEEAKDKE